MVWKFCEIWKSYGIWGPEVPKFCEILSHSVRYGMYAAGKVLCQSIAISGNDRQSLAAQFFFAATMPLPSSDIMAQNLFHKGMQLSEIEYILRSYA